MKRIALIALAAAVVAAAPALAHPGSAIVVDRSGRVYFIDTGSGLWRIEAGGKLTRIPGPAFHWMTLDQGDTFGRLQLPSGPGWEIDRAGSDPTLLLSSDFPLAIGGDGNLYYPSQGGSGPRRIFRVQPSGTSSVLAQVPLPWLNGLAAGPDGALYYTGNSEVHRIGKDGAVSTVAEHVAPPGCVAIPGNDPNEGPLLRSIAVDARGTLYVTASGCGSLLKITPAGQVTVLLQLQSPWSPTGVALHGDTLYVLEYLHTAVEDRGLWLPRVRRLTPDGRSAIVAAITRP